MSDPKSQDVNPAACKTMRDLMVKLRDDARERGLDHLAVFYGAEAVRHSAEGLVAWARSMKNGSAGKS